MPDSTDILIDVSRIIWRLSKGRMPTGIDRVCLAYIDYFRDQSQAVVQWRGIRRILTKNLSQQLFHLIISEPKNFRKRLLQLSSRSIFHLAHSESGNGRLYLNIGHTGLDWPNISRWIEKVDVRPIYMLHDLIPITHPKYCRIGSLEKHEKRIDTMARSGVGIICNSQSTLDIMANYVTQRRLPMPPMLDAWLGATPPPVSRANIIGFTEPYFVTLGTIEGRKNHIMLLKTWKALIAKHGAFAPRLIIIGQRGWKNDEVFALLDHDASLRSHVSELPRCTDAELAQYLRGAAALLFPSFAEGYGMPLVEALGIGTPVIASNLPVFRELAGDIPEYLAPNDGIGWQSIVEKYSQPGSVSRSAQLARMTGYAMPTWNQHFAKVDDWLSRL